MDLSQAQPGCERCSNQYADYHEPTNLYLCAPCFEAANPEEPPMYLRTYTTTTRVKTLAEAAGICRSLFVAGALLDDGETFATIDRFGFMRDADGKMVVL